MSCKQTAPYCLQDRTEGGGQECSGGQETRSGVLRTVVCSRADKWRSCLGYVPSRVHRVPQPEVMLSAQHWSQLSNACSASCQCNSRSLCSGPG